MRYFITILLILVAMPVFAQKKVKIEDVHVNVSRKVENSATTKTIIDSAALANSKNTTLSDLLSKNSPIFVKSYGLGSQATVSFRGTAASHTQVEWNGVNINNPMLGQVDFSMIPVWFVDKVEVLHGGSSLGEGSGALGGTVTLGSVPRWNDKLYGSVMQGVGSFGNYQTFAKVGGGSDRVHIKVGMMYEQAENDFEFYNNGVLPFRYQKQENADYKKYGAVADLFTCLNNNHFVSVSGWYHTAKRNLPNIMSYEGKGRTEWQEEEEGRAVARWRWFGTKLTSEFTSGFSTTSLDYFMSNVTDIEEFVNINSKSSIFSLYNNYKLSYNISPRSLLKLNADFDHHNVKTLNHITEEGYKNNRTEYGASVSFHTQMSDRFSGYALARLEDNGNFMPSLGVEYELISNFIVKANGTRNYHRPTLNDLYWLPGGNPDLKAEKGYTGDLALEYFTKKSLFSVTTFMSKIDDWIIWQPSEYRYWKAYNMKKVFSRGVEVKFTTKWSFGKWNFSFNGNYAYTKTTNEEPQSDVDESKGKQLIYIPLHKSNLMLDVVYRGFNLTYGWCFIGERFTNSSNTATMHDLPAYDLHNITIGKRLNNFDLEVKIDNLFNKDYQAILWRAMPRRSYAILLKYSF